MKAEHITLSPAEDAFYFSGVARGRSEGRDEIANHLQAASVQFNNQIASLEEVGAPNWEQIARFLACQFDLLAKQIRPAVAESSRLATAKLGVAIKARSVPVQSPVISGSFDLTMESRNA